MPISPPPISANQFLFAQDYQLALLDALKRGRTVTRFTLEPRDESSDAPVIEFEIVVTKLGNRRLPRSTKDVR